MPERICVGRILGAHGVRGLVRLRSFTADPAAVAEYGPLSDADDVRRFVVRLVNRAKDDWVARVEGVTDRTAAESLVGVDLYVDRSVLPPADEDEFYHADLIGLRAVTVDGAVLGRVAAVHDFGAGDVLEITGDNGAVVPVPFTRAVVPEIDIAGGLLVVDPPAGLLEDPEPPPVREKA